VKKLMKEYQDRVHFVIRYMPYHGNSMYAASALAEAWEMSKFESALDVLFEKQPEWGDHHQPRPDLIPGYLESVGFSKDKTTAEYLIQKHGDKVKMDEADGRRVGVQGVPSFYVNGRALNGLGEKPLRAAIEDALK
jgi:protein-disulfide isomerase